MEYSTVKGVILIKTCVCDIPYPVSVLRFLSLNEVLSYSAQMRENAVYSNSKYGHFLRSKVYV